MQPCWRDHFRSYPRCTRWKTPFLAKLGCVLSASHLELFFQSFTFFRRFHLAKIPLSSRCFLRTHGCTIGEWIKLKVDKPLWHMALQWQRPDAKVFVRQVALHPMCSTQVRRGHHVYFTLRQFSKTQVRLKYILLKFRLTSSKMRCLFNLVQYCTRCISFPSAGKISRAWSRDCLRKIQPRIYWLDPLTFFSDYTGSVFPTPLLFRCIRKVWRIFSLGLRWLNKSIPDCMPAVAIKRYQAGLLVT